MTHQDRERQHLAVLWAANQDRAGNASIRRWFLRHKRHRQAVVWRLRWQRQQALKAAA